MIILYILGLLAASFFVYILFVGICSLFVKPKKEYERSSRFYRFLMHSATSSALKLLRIKVHTTGIDKVPTNVMPLFMDKHRSKFNPIIQWHIFKKRQLAFISKASNLTRLESVAQPNKSKRSIMYAQSI